LIKSSFKFLLFSAITSWTALLQPFNGSIEHSQKRQHLRHTPIGSKQHASLQRQQVPKKARDRGHKKIARGGLTSSKESVGQKPVTNLE